MKKIFLPALISVVFLTSCSQALYKNKYDWVKVDRQPSTSIAKTETKPGVSSSEEQPAASVAIDSLDQVDSCATATYAVSNDEESRLRVQKEMKPADTKSFKNESRVAGTVLKVKKSVKSGFNKLKFRKASDDENLGPSVWGIVRIILIIGAIGFLIWLVGGWEAMLITLAIGAGIIIGVMLIIYLICELIFEIIGEIFS